MFRREIGNRKANLITNLPLEGVKELVSQKQIRRLKSKTSRHRFNHIEFAKSDRLNLNVSLYGKYTSSDRMTSILFILHEMIG